MPISVTVGNATYPIPIPGDVDFGSNFVAWAQAVSATATAAAGAGATPTFASVAALRNAPVAVSPASVKGFSTVGDGGGGIFYWDTSGIGSLNDNIGIVITSSQSGAGKWKRDGFVGQTNGSQNYNGVLDAVNVKWFGAKGDGVTIDSAAIQNAINAAKTLSTNLSQLGSVSLSVNPLPVVDVLLPAGAYMLDGSVNGNTCLEVPGGVRLVGHGRTILQCSGTSLNLVRLTGPYAHVSNIVFKGGRHSIALYGHNTSTLTDWNPTTLGNAPINVRSCVFDYPAGPAIWQDTGPATVIASGSNNQSLPTGTINVGSTVGFPASGSINIALANNAFTSVSYTGTTSTTFTGCTGGSGTLLTGQYVVNQALWRSFQGALRVEDYHLFGPHLFWGTGDTVMFNQGHLSYDLTTVKRSSDGLPLGIFNSADQLIVTDQTAAGTGSPATRSAVFVGHSNAIFQRSTWGQTAIDTFARFKTHGLGYDGGTGVAVDLPYGQQAADNFDLTIDGFDPGNVVAAVGDFWLECYEAPPTCIRLKNWRTTAGWVTTTGGIWFNSDVSLTTLLNAHTISATFDADGQKDLFTVFRVFQGFDQGASTTPAQVFATEITDVLKKYLVGPEAPQETAYSANLYQGNVDGTTDGFNLSGGSHSGDTTSGFSIGKWTSTAAGQLTPNITIPFATLMPNNLAAGIYCLSWYWYANWDGIWEVTCNATGSSSTTKTAVPFEASGTTLKRLWFTFFYPGAAASWRAIIQAPSGVTPITAWPASTSVIQGQRCTNGGNVYLCIQAGTTAGSGGPGGTGSGIVDGGAKWDFVKVGGTFTPTCAWGLTMLNPGRVPSMYTEPAFADASVQFGYVPQTFYVTTVPASTSLYKKGDRAVNIAATNSGDIRSWYFNGTAWKSEGTLP